MTEQVGVVDIGSSSVKVGYSGDDTPFSIFPSLLTKQTKFTECIESNPESSLPHSEFGVNNRQESSSHPIIRGEVRDWEKLSKLWENVTMELDIESVDTASILLVESMKTTKKDRSRWAEMLFESHHAPSICFLNSASASIYASGRTSGLSIDCGAGLTSCVPVYEGLPLKHAALISDYGGQDVSQNLQQLLMTKHINLSFNDIRLIKESRAYISNNIVDTPRSNDARTTTLILPDGVEVEVEEDVFAECTSHIFHDDKEHHKGLASQAYDCIGLCDDSLKRLLYGNIILSGGTSQLPGYGDHLKRELYDKTAANLVVRNDGQIYDVHVIPNSSSREAGYTTQSKYAAWIGGSIIGSMDTYKDIKITRQEWEENADSVVDTKCY